jgi:hypothetical protein
MFLPSPAALVATSFIIGVADGVPKFNLIAICRVENMRGSDYCVRSETAARDDLARQWARFPAADRARCVQLATMTKMPGYLQVLTCLKMARHRQLDSTATRDQPPPARSQAPNDDLMR